MVYILLILALIAPVLGTIALRLFGDRLNATQIIVSAAILFSVAIGSTLILSRSHVAGLRVGNLTLLLPVRNPNLPSPELPPNITLQPDPTFSTSTPLISVTPPATTTVTATVIISDPSAPVSPTLGIESTATPEPPTATPEPPTATPEPPTATPEPPTAVPEPPAGQRRYVVQPGDTLRSIADQFGVSVKALLEINNLTVAQADSLEVGQELIIP